MLGRLGAAGWTETENPANAYAIIINTCSFIESAAAESIDTILCLAQYKKNGKCRRMVVVGCLPQRYGEDIVAALPEVDIFLGTGAFDRILDAVENPLLLSSCWLPDPDAAALEHVSIQRVRDVPHMAYLKIAEGCNRQCTYCIIPKLRGKQKSRFPTDIIHEAKTLIRDGVRELVLVSQDTTSYGKDLSNVDLSDVLTEISDISEDIWIRMLYAHPESMTSGLIHTVAERNNICSYFDIPIQHASPRILKRMGRCYGADDLLRMFEGIRKTIFDASLRTTVMVGFPGETDDDFLRLVHFVEEVRFDHLGVFIYSDSQDLPSHRLGDPVPKEAAEERYHWLMSCQRKISQENCQKHIGKTVSVLVEKQEDPTVFIGRTRFQAPEVDGATIINTEGKQHKLKMGGFNNIKITDALEYDLLGEPV
jgi:ribosomal protein S12 methylthiotransferase